jgi:hypothetical protein
MKTFFKIIGYTFLFFIALGVIGALIDDDSSSSTSSGSETTGAAIKTEFDEEMANEKAEVAKPDIELLKHNAKWGEYGNSVTIHCRVKNNTNKLASYVEVSVTFFDKDGTVVGTGMGNTTNFAAGKERTIDALAMNIEDAAKYEVDITNVYW